MDKVQTIAHEVKSLSPAELATFHSWFREFDSEAWDRQMAEDAKAGKLDALANSALKSFQSGRYSQLKGSVLKQLKGSIEGVGSNIPTNPTGER